MHSLGSLKSACHDAGIRNCYHKQTMANLPKLSPFCANGCSRRIKPHRAGYCSRRCFVEHRRQRVVALWQSGALPPRLYFNRTVRRHIIEVAGEKCQRCGWNERNPFTGRVPLEIEHVDGNWENNAPENIGVLCPNCHALTATFRGANRGRGRPGRPGLLESYRVRPEKFPWDKLDADQPLFSTFPGPGTLGYICAVMALRERTHRSQADVAAGRRACAGLREVP